MVYGTLRVSSCVTQPVGFLGEPKTQLESFCRLWVFFKSQTQTKPLLPIAITHGSCRKHIFSWRLWHALLLFITALWPSWCRCEHCFQRGVSCLLVKGSARGILVSVVSFLEVHKYPFLIMKWAFSSWLNYCHPCLMFCCWDEKVCVWSVIMNCSFWVWAREVQKDPDNLNAGRQPLFDIFEGLVYVKH